MKHISLIVSLILVTLFCYCDRPISQKERLDKAVSEFNKNLKSNPVNNYYPESYTEIKTDSIIAHTFEVSLKNYTSMEDHIVLNTHSDKVQKTTEYHRVFVADILVTTHDQLIYKKHISAENFRDVSPSEFWKNATLEHVWVNQEASNSQELNLELSFINPQRDSFKRYALIIDRQGNERMKLIEDHS